jgi:hypothetical protein
MLRSANRLNGIQMIYSSRTKSLNGTSSYVLFSFCSHFLLSSTCYSFLSKIAFNVTRALSWTIWGGPPGCRLCVTFFRAIDLKSCRRYVHSQSTIFMRSSGLGLLDVVTSINHFPRYRAKLSFKNHIFLQTTVIETKFRM